MHQAQSSHSTRSRCVLFVTLDELADGFQVSTRTVRRRCDEGRFPPPDDLGGGVKRWRSAVIEAWTSDGCPPMSRWKRFFTFYPNNPRRV